MTLYETLNKTLNVFSRGNYTSTTIFATIESSHVCEYGQFTVEQREFEIEQTAEKNTAWKAQTVNAADTFNTRFYISSLYVRASPQLAWTPWCSPFYRRARWNVSSRMFLAECLQSCNTGSSHWKGECVVFCRRNLLLLTKLPPEDIDLTQII